MRTSLLTLSSAALMLLACQPPATEEAETAAPVDVQQVESEVRAFVADFMAAQKRFDFEAIRGMTADDGLFMGTDPGELFGKDELMGEMQRISEIEGVDLDFTVDEERIRVADDGQSAVVVQQFMLDLISQHIPVRWTYHLVKEGDGWLVDVTNIALIPLNRDLRRIDAAFEGEPAPVGR